MKIKPIVYGIFGVAGAVAIIGMFGYNFGYEMLDMVVEWVVPLAALNYLPGMFNKKGKDLVSMVVKQWTLEIEYYTSCIML